MHWELTQLDPVCGTPPSSVLWLQVAPECLRILFLLLHFVAKHGTLADNCCFPEGLGIVSILFSHPCHFCFLIEGLMQSRLAL